MKRYRIFIFFALRNKGGEDGQKEALFHQIMGGGGKDIFFSSFFNEQKAIKNSSPPPPNPRAK